MVKKAIAFSDWPFKNGEKVKLIKISKPFLNDGRWYLNVVFMSLEKKEAKTLKRFFSDLHLLVVGAHYVDGIRLEMTDWQTETLDIKNGDLFYKRIEPYLKKDRLDAEFNYYTFGIGFNEKYYVFPLLEIVRAIFAPDVFWLNQIIMLDSIDTRVQHDIDEKKLKICFSNDVPIRYVKMDETIKHIAWIFTNDNIFRMMNQIYQNIYANKGVLFDFNFNDFAISFKYEESDRMRYVKEIIAFRRKWIFCEEIIVRHPGLIEHDENAKNDEEEKTRLIRELSSGTKELSMSDNALANLIDIEDGFTDFGYASVVKIHRVKKKRNVDKNKKLNLNLDDANGKLKRTTADFGGIEAIPQLEFFQSTKDNLEDDFNDIKAILLLMKERREVISIEFYIGYLQDHLQNRVICKLDDRKSLRKYLIGKIKFKNGLEAVVIEIQRESKSISTLMCISHNFQNLEYDLHRIIKGFIAKSGVWPKISELQLTEREVFRFKHTDASIDIKEKRIFKSIYK